jgi:hypothetical protein
MHTAATTGLTTLLAFAAMLAVHGIADLWVQTHHQALHKGDHSWPGRWNCARHVATYTACTLLAVLLVTRWLDLGAHATGWGITAGQALSAVTHYAIDRRWTLAAWARALGKHDLHALGAPRRLQVYAVHVTTGTTVGGRHRHAEETVLVPLDQSVLGTGAYHLDQSLHVGWLFVAALLTALL